MLGALFEQSEQSFIPFRLALLDGARSGEWV
jgi:hypothetical protein